MATTEIVARYLNLIQSIHVNYLSELAPSKQEAFEQNLLSLRRGIRWYQIATQAQVEEIWALIRDTEDDGDILEYVLMGTAEMMLRGKNHSQEWDNLRSSVIESLVWVTNDKYIDEAITTRGPDYTWLKESFEQSPWLLFLCLHRFVNQV